jgi:hypothetical protein
VDDFLLFEEVALLVPEEEESPDSVTLAAVRDIFSFAMGKKIEQYCSSIVE